MRILSVENASDFCKKRVWLNDREVSVHAHRARVPNRPGVTGIGWVDRYEVDAEGHIIATEEGATISYRSYGPVRWGQRGGASLWKGGRRSMRILSADNPDDFCKKRVWLNGKEVTDQAWQAKVPSRPGVTGIGWVNRYRVDAQEKIIATEEGSTISYRSYGLVRWAQRAEA